MTRSTDSTSDGPLFSEAIVAALKALSATLRGNYATIVVDQRTFEVRLVHEERYLRAGLSLSYPTTNSRTGAPSTLSAIVVREEGSADVLGKSLGINREVQIGDEAFDEAYYIESAAPAADVRAVLNDKTLPYARAVLAKGPLVLYEGNAVARVIVDSTDEREVTSAAIEAHCRALRALVDALPYDQAVAVAKPRRAHRAPVALAVVAMAVGGWILLPDSAKVARLEPSIVGFALGALVAVVVSAVAARAVRGRADSLRAAGEIAAPLIICGTIFGGIALPALNVRLDNSAGEARELRVERATIVRPSKGSPSLRVRLVATHGEAPELDITMSTDAAALYAERTLCRARLYPGRFGWAWWGELRRIEPQVTPGVVQASSQGTNAGAP
ncbi:MAG: hypothetical protein JNK05_32455 [Myxococcales bacterium]|nr:hypothetical protein [Myxococcales bacterium]